MARDLDDKPEMRPNKDHLQRADRRGTDLDERITANLHLGETDDNIEALVVEHYPK